MLNPTVCDVLGYKCLYLEIFTRTLFHGSVFQIVISISNRSSKGQDAPRATVEISLLTRAVQPYLPPPTRLGGVRADASNPDHGVSLSRPAEVFCADFMSSSPCHGSQSALKRTRRSDSVTRDWASALRVRAGKIETRKGFGAAGRAASVVVLQAHLRTAVT